MKIRIKETGEIKRLEILDPETGRDWVERLLHKYDQLDEIQERGPDGVPTGTGVMRRNEFEWWEKVTAEYQEANHRVYDLFRQLKGALQYRFRQAVDNLDVDLDEMAQALHRICYKFEMAVNDVVIPENIWIWDCPRCDQRHFFPVSKEHKFPKEVYCRGCGREYRTMR